MSIFLLHKKLVPLIVNALCAICLLSLYVGNVVFEIVEALYSDSVGSI